MKKNFFYWLFVTDKMEIRDYNSLKKVNDND